ncbi:MAG: LCP family protein [Oscillospiraceae bacterium]|nr:LCP family protein [Oscillospiraceae bacterium]
MDKKLKPKNIIILLLIFALILVGLFSVVKIVENLMHGGKAPEATVPSKTILRDGVEYYPRQDMLVILVAGIDETGPVQHSGSYNNPGEADMVSLVIFDQTAEKIDVLALNRDTMLDMPVLGIGGKPAGTRHGQLALAHTYGSGLTDSGENLKKTVSDFLYGLKIDYYVTMNMDAIALFNDAVGGVTVKVEDDFSAIDPTIGTGTVTLNGQQAISFLRSRQGLGDQLNLSRMERQKQYMVSFVESLRTTLSADSAAALTIYQELSPYMVTDLSDNAMLGLVDFYRDYSMGTTYTPDGENVVKEYMEYHVDADALDKLILQLLYAPKS